MESDRLVDLHQVLLQRKVEMPEGSSTARLLRQGVPKILEKCTEEMGEAFQALLEQDASQVNLEVSQVIYNLMVLMVATGKGDMGSVVTELERKTSNPKELPETLGLAIRNCAESMGEAYFTLLSETSDSEEANLKVADVIYNFQNAMELTHKGSWEGVLQEL